MHVSLKTITSAFIPRHRSSRTDNIVYRRRAGGKGANQAEAVVRAGVTVSLVGAVGEDGAWLIRDLEGYVVSTANLSVVQVRYVPVFPRIICYIIYVVGGHWSRYHSNYSTRRKLHQYVNLRLPARDMTSKQLFPPPSSHSLAQGNKLCPVRSSDKG